MNDMKEVIIVTDFNKYEILEELRKYKHQIKNLSPQEFDILLPRIKQFIFSINKLKEGYLLKLQEYDNEIKSEYFEKCILKFKNEMKLLKGSDVENNMYQHIILRFISDSNIYIKDIEIDDEKKYFSETVGFPLMQEFIDEICSKFSISEETSKIPSILSDIFINILNLVDYKILQAEEFIPYYAKTFNYIKIATNFVLSELEYFLFDNIEKAKEIRDTLHKNSLCTPKRFKNEHIELLKLRKNLSPDNTYKNIIPHMTGEYKEHSIKALAREINDILGTRNIDEALRVYEKEYGEI